MSRYQAQPCGPHSGEHWVVMQWSPERPEENKWDIPTDERFHQLFADWFEAQAAIDEVMKEHR